MSDSKKPLLIKLAIAVVGLILFGVAAENIDTIKLHSFFGIIGIVFALYRRRKAQEKREQESLIKIVANDYLMTRNATLPIVSIIYTLLQGALIGASSSLLIDSILTLIWYRNSEFALILFGSCLAGILILLISRISLEAATVIVRFGEDFSQFRDDFTRYSKK